MHGDDNRANLCICTNMDGGLVMVDLTGMTPVEAARAVKESNELVFNPFPSNTPEMKQYLDELLDLTTEASNAKV